MYSLKYKVATSTCDSEGNLKMYSALQMMQDCSEMWLESEPEVKAYFACENMTQLLASRQVEVLRVPSFKEELTVSTSVYEVKAMFGYRNTFIYDADGRPVQHLQYLPFGQSFVNQHTTGYQERYTFTGKERDEETGYGYFGARYMDHELMTMWLSVDPMADKYPSISPYAYCAWNPVKLIDQDGKESGIPPKSRITVRNGCVILKMDNLHNSTRSRINWYNSDPANWPSGQIGAIGPLAYVKIDKPEMMDPQGGYGYSQPSKTGIRTQAVNARSTGLPDRRVRPHFIASNGSQKGVALLAAIDVVNYTLTAITAGLWNNDMKNVNKQLSLMESAFEDVKMYVQREGFPQEYKTANQMLYIANYVLQKENVTHDPMVKQIGEEIRVWVGYKYNNQIQQCGEKY